MKKKTPVFPRQLEALLRAIPDAVYVLDATGRIMHANPAAQLHTGWEPAQLVGHSVIDALLFALPFRSAIMPALRDTGVFTGESERIMPDGSLRTVRAQWQRLPEPLGDTHFIGVEHDITEQRMRELEFHKSRKLAKIGILAEGIAHELRNPLSYALSAAQLLNEEGLQDEVRLKCIQTITTGVKKAGLIVDNLLSLGKPKPQFARTRVSIEHVLAEAFDAASTHPHYHGVRISHHLPGDALFVTGNHDMLVQVFHNVISNALNELPDGGGIVVSGEQDDRIVCVRITDSGPGVSEEKMKHLFDPFFTASSSGTGTGLGLTLSYYIMKEHAGSIEVESRPGAGATFVLTFPAPST